MKISTETNRNLVLFLIYCLALNCVPIFVEKNFALPVFKTQDKQHLIRVDASRIKNAETKKIIANTVKESPFAVKEIDNAGSWNLRFRSDAKDANKILVEREGETLIKEISLSEDNFSNQVAEFIRREYRWQSLRYLENENTNANVSVELKVVPIKNPRIEDGRLKFDEETADNVAREQLKEGDYFVFEPLTKSRRALKTSQVKHLFPANFWTTNPVAIFSFGSSDKFCFTFRVHALACKTAALRWRLAN